jgi:hypothetical protein
MRLLQILLLVIALLALTAFAFDPQTTITWTSCKGAKASVNKVQCASIEVPLLWDESSDERSVTFFVRRVQCKNATPRQGQLWLLNGDVGPIDGSTLYTQYDTICKSLHGYDIMIPDHRGTGKSSQLGSDCTKLKLKSFRDCYNHVRDSYKSDGLRGFGTTMAAKDVLHFAKYSKTDGDKVVVMGVAYGTYWLNRILTVAPSDINLAIADTVLSPTLEASAVDDQHTTVGTELLSLCQSASACISHFNSSQLSLNDQITQILDKQDSANACQGTHRKAAKVQKFSSERLRTLYAGMLRDIPLSKFILPSLYRLNRCSDEDKKWLQNMGYSLTLTSNKGTFFYSPTNNTTPTELLYYVIAASELSSSPLPQSASYWTQKYSTYPPFFKRNQSPTATYKLDIAQEDRYDEPLAGSLATNYNNPLLVLHGTLSPIAPKYMGQVWEQHFNNSQTQFVWVRNAQSAISFNTAMADAKDTRNAGLVVVLAWINANGAHVNTTIIQSWRHYTYNFNSSTKNATIIAYKGLWEGAPAKTIQKYAMIKIARSLGIGLGILALTTIAFIVLMIFDGTVCKVIADKTSQRYLQIEDSGAKAL